MRLYCLLNIFSKFSESNQHNLFMSSSEYAHMRIEDKDGDRFLVIESDEDLEEFRKMLIEAYYELHPDSKPSRET